MMHVAVKVLVQSHQPFLLFIRLVHDRKLWTGVKEIRVSCQVQHRKTEDKRSLHSVMPRITEKNYMTFEVFAMLFNAKTTDINSTQV